MCSDKIAQLKEQIRKQKEAEEKGEKLVVLSFLLSRTGSERVPRSVWLSPIHKEDGGAVVRQQVHGNAGTDPFIGPHCDQQSV